jgi:hypothetical protein
MVVPFVNALESKKGLGITLRLNSYKKINDFTFAGLSVRRILSAHRARAQGIGGVRSSHGA